MNSEETFDATEELCNLNKNNGEGTSGDNKKRARTIFGTNYGDGKSSKQTGSGPKAQTRAKPKFFLGQSTAVNKNNNNSNILFLKKNYADVCAGKNDIVQTSEVVEIFPQHPPTPTPTPEAEKKECKPKKRKAKHKCFCKNCSEKKEVQGKNGQTFVRPEKKRFAYEAYKFQCKHIQLPFGVVRDKSKEKSMKLNLLPNFRKMFV